MALQQNGETEVCLPRQLIFAMSASGLFASSFVNLIRLNEAPEKFTYALIFAE